MEIHVKRMPITNPRNHNDIAAEAARLRTEAIRFGSGELTAEAFRGQRALQGIYEQRHRGTYLLRLRLATGSIHVEQLERLSELALSGGVERLHFTTRQDVQLHDLTLESALRLQEELLSVGLYSYGSGGNTVRNIVVDPLSGLVDDEAFDVRTYALALDRRYLGPDRHPSLPRKFKIAISSSDADRAGAAIADLGFVAMRRGGALGFRVFVAGGLGLSATIGLELYSWIDAKHLIAVADAVLAFFAEHGDRTNRHRARLRHLRKHMGDPRFIEACREVVAIPVQTQGDLGDVASVVEAAQQPSSASCSDLYRVAGRGILAQASRGRYSIRLAPLHGDVTPAALRRVAMVAREFGSSTIRVGLEQEIWISDVSEGAVDIVLAQLKGLGLGTPDERSQPIVACSGAATCQLGLLRSRDAADAIDEVLAIGGVKSVIGEIRISGCPNSCGRHQTAALGFEGRVKRIGIRRLPCYSVYAGAALGGSTTVLGQPLGVVPAKRVPELVTAIASLASTNASSRATIDDWSAIVDRLSALPTEVPESWFTDWGDEKPRDQSELG